MEVIETVELWLERLVVDYSAMAQGRVVDFWVEVEISL